MSMNPDTNPVTFGLLAEFHEPDELLEAATRIQAEGYRDYEAYSPMPVEGLPEAVGFPRSRMPFIVLIGAICGGVIGFLMQYVLTVHVYPLNIGGRPLNSWPSFIPVTFELTILLAGLSAVLGMLAMNGLPRPYHPLFAIPEFDRASQDRFFVCIRATDPKYHDQTTREFLQGLGAKEVIHVPW